MVGQLTHTCRWQGGVPSEVGSVLLLNVRPSGASLRCEHCGAQFTTIWDEDFKGVDKGLGRYLDELPHRAGGDQ